MHPFFISMTEVNYNSKTKIVEVSVRIFADDFEKTLAKSCNCKVDMLLASNKNANDKLIGNYIARHLAIAVDGKPVTLQYQGYQQEEGSIWSYFEVPNVTAFHKLSMQNNILYEYDNSQINMVHVKANGKEQSDKLEYPDKYINWQF